MGFVIEPFRLLKKCSPNTPNELAIDAGIGISQPMGLGSGIGPSIFRTPALLRPLAASGAGLPRPLAAFCAIRGLAGPSFGQPWALRPLHPGVRTLKHRKARVKARYSQHCAVDLIGQLTPLTPHGVKAMAKGDAGEHGVARIDKGRQVDAFEHSPHQGQTAVAAQIIRQLFDNKINRFGHERFLHLQGERHLGAKCLICIRIYS